MPSNGIGTKVVVNSRMPEWMVTVYSAPRLAPYLASCSGDPIRAANLYHWNVMVSSAFYGPLHTFELALRNALHRCLSAHFGRDDWWASAPLGQETLRLVEKARGRCGPSPTPDDIVTELNLGFWIALVSRRYDRELWVPALHRAFPGYRGRRGALHHRLDSLRLLRNRIMHHEPIHHRHLEKDHEELYRVLEHLGPDIVAAIKTLDRVPDVLLLKEPLCRGDLPPSF